VTRILSSPTIRCLQTVTPLAADRGLQVETVGALAVDGDARHVLRMLTGPGLTTAVLCTHGEVIGAVLDYSGEAGLRLLDPPRREKGSVWVVEGGYEPVLEARYVGPAQPPATARAARLSCPRVVATHQRFLCHSLALPRTAAGV
jgi:broad specificity phosphatase PhoE